VSGQRHCCNDELAVLGGGTADAGGLQAASYWPASTKNVTGLSCAGGQPGKPANATDGRPKSSD